MGFGLDLQLGLAQMTALLSPLGGAKALQSAARTVCEGTPRIAPPEVHAQRDADLDQIQGVFVGGSPGAPSIMDRLQASFMALGEPGIDWRMVTGARPVGTWSGGDNCLGWWPKLDDPAERNRWFGQYVPSMQKIGVDPEATRRAREVEQRAAQRAWEAAEGIATAPQRGVAEVWRQARGGIERIAGGVGEVGNVIGKALGPTLAKGVAIGVGALSGFLAERVVSHRGTGVRIIVPAVIIPSVTAVLWPKENGGA